MTKSNDLVLERTLNAPRDLVWKAWTDPKLLKQWFAPKPYEICEVNYDGRIRDIDINRRTANWRGY